MGPISYMEYLKKRFKKEVFPLGIVLSSLLMNILFYHSYASKTGICLEVLDRTYCLINKSDIFHFNIIIVSFYLFFLGLDIFYEVLSSRRNFFYYREVYAIFNLLLLIALGWQFSVIQYNLGKIGDINTYFLPIASIGFFAIIIIILRIILRSGSRGLY